MKSGIHSVWRNIQALSYINLAWPHPLCLDTLSILCQLSSCKFILQCCIFVASVYHWPIYRGRRRGLQTDSRGDTWIQGIRTQVGPNTEPDQTGAEAGDRRLGNKDIILRRSIIRQIAVDSQEGGQDGGSEEETEGEERIGQGVYERAFRNVHPSGEYLFNSFSSSFVHSWSLI